MSGTVTWDTCVIKSRWALFFLSSVGESRDAQIGARGLARVPQEGKDSPVVRHRRDFTVTNWVTRVRLKREILMKAAKYRC